VILNLLSRKTKTNLLVWSDSLVLQSQRNRRPRRSLNNYAKLAKQSASNAWKKLKHPPSPPPPKHEPSKHDPPAQEHDDVETVYVKKRSTAKKAVVSKSKPNKPRRKKKIVYVEPSSSDESNSSSSEDEIQYVKRRSRKPKQRLALVKEEPLQHHPQPQQSMFQYHDNGDVMW
jgi:hypothetical protein